jgi:hypothetical protein
MLPNCESEIHLSLNFDVACCTLWKQIPHQIKKLIYLFMVPRTPEVFLLFHEIGFFSNKNTVNLYVLTLALPTVVTIHYRCSNCSDSGSRHTPIVRVKPRRLSFFFRCLKIEINLFIHMYMVWLGKENRSLTPSKGNYHYFIHLPKSFSKV